MDEKVAKYINRVRTRLVTGEERRAMVEREAKEKGQAKEEREAGRVGAKIVTGEERCAMVERESKEKGQAMEEREAGRVRAEKEVEEQRDGKDEDRQARVEREAEEERQDRAKRMEEITNGETLYKAICGNNWTSAKEFLDKNPSMLTTKITSSGKTALHVAALFGHVSLVEELVTSVPPQPGNYR